MAKEDAIELEFYEIAFNINTLHNEITTFIVNAENEFNKIFNSTTLEI